MASNKHYTFLVVPEKTQKVIKFILPGFLVRGGVIALILLSILAVIMILDYTNVMSQIYENQKLKQENAQLKQEVQEFKTKMIGMESTLDRIKIFVTKLRMITNVEPYFAPAPATTSPLPGTPAEPQTQQHEESTQQKSIRFLFTQLNEAKADTLPNFASEAWVEEEFDILEKGLVQLEGFALDTAEDTQDLIEQLGAKRALLASTPTRIPTIGGYISSTWGLRISPIDGRRKMHEGIDIANRYGSDIIAPADATVSFSGFKPGYGQTVMLNHQNGLETRYAHCSRLFVKSGDRVHRGQKIAAIGNTGHSTGPHLHYEVHASGTPVDPCSYVFDAACISNRSSHLKPETDGGKSIIDTE